MHTTDPTRIALSPVRPDDFEQLVSVRIDAMRASLERVGRFDAQRARERLLDGFAPECTRHILVDGQRVGFVTVKPRANELSVEHFYVRPAYQGRGIGSWVIGAIFEEADRLGLPMRVGALRGSDSNRFYARHGFVRAEETEWDIYYLRLPRGHVSGVVGAASRSPGQSNQQ